MKNLKAIMLGTLAAFFFAFTFILNRQMDLAGGSWVWSAVLRYLFMLPILGLIVLFRGNMTGVFHSMKIRPLPWIVWSTVGFGIFYAPVCLAAKYSPAWLVAATWQITIIAGVLLTPVFHKRIPLKSLAISLLILIGIFTVQINKEESSSIREVLIGIVPVIIGAFAYPLGNRKMMEVCEGKVDTFQRVFGMTLMSMPFWTALSVFGAVKYGPPGGGQIFQSFIVAVCSGVVATVLFFRATDMVSGNMQQLAAVEATQSGEVLFALLGEILVFGVLLPDIGSIIGIILIIAGIILHSLLSH